MRHFLRLSAAFALAASTTAFAADKTYPIDRVIIKGNHALTTEQLMAVVTLHHGDKVAAAVVANNAHAIQKAYDAVPNVDTHIEANLLPNKAGDAYNAVFALTETASAPPPPATKVAPKLHALVFDGNKKIDTQTLIAAAAIKPGDDLTNDKVAAMQQAIADAYKAKKLGVSVAGENKKNEDGTYDVIWHITEQGGAKKKDDADWKQ